MHKGVQTVTLSFPICEMGLELMNDCHVFFNGIICVNKHLIRQFRS